MSHIVTIDVKLRDLDAIEAACRRLGLELRRGQTTFRWFGTYVGDYQEANAAVNHGIRPEEMGTCDHAIGIPGDRKSYEVGLRLEGDGYRVLFDTWTGAGQDMFNRVGGEQCHKLLQAYAIEKAKLEARRAGHTVTEQAVANGAVKLRIHVAN